MKDKKFTFVRALVFTAVDKDDAWKQLEDHLNEEKNDYSYFENWAIDTLESDYDEND